MTLEREHSQSHVRKDEVFSQEIQQGKRLWTQKSHKSQTQRGRSGDRLKPFAPNSDQFQISPTASPEITQFEELGYS